MFKFKICNIKTEKIKIYVKENNGYI